MVQVLPYVPSFGEQLGPVLGKAIGDISSGYFRGRQNKADQTILNDVFSNPDLTDIQRITRFGQLSADKLKSLSPLYPSIAAAFKPKEIDQTQINDAEERESNQRLATDLEETLPKTGFSFGNYFGYNNLFNRENIEDRERFNKEGFILADKVFTHFNKGTITKEKLDYIKKELAPNSELSNRTNAGRIKTLTTVLKLPRDASESEVDKIIGGLKGKKNDESPKLEKVKAGTKATQDVVNKAVEEYGNDRKKVKAALEKLGYEFD